MTCYQERPSLEALHSPSGHSGACGIWKSRMAFLIAATIILLVLVDLVHGYCVEGHGLHLAAAAVVAVVTTACHLAGRAAGPGAACLPCAAPQQLTV